MTEQEDLPATPPPTASVKAIINVSSIKRPNNTWEDVCKNFEKHEFYAPLLMYLFRSYWPRPLVIDYAIAASLAEIGAEFTQLVSMGEELGSCHYDANRECIGE